MAAGRGAEKCVDRLHVRDRVAKPRLEWLAGENGLGKCIDLFAILIDRPDRNFLAPAAGQIAAIVEDKDSRLIGRRIEGNGDFQTPARSKHCDLLRERQLRGTGKGKLPSLWKRQQPARQPVRAEDGIALHERDRPHRFRVEQEARRVDGITTNVEQTAAANIHLIAHISGSSR
ncbi:Uncharacterised protein [Agrobacterium tumefaciens]|nr:Uncharacterised protein [Agrobacterium tumefaciens]